MVVIRIEVFSDTLCPWCYIGKKYLDNAIDIFRRQHPQASFDVVWKPFYLYPNLEKHGQPKSKLLEPIPDEIQQRIAQAGSKVGINFRLDLGTTGSSSASHALLALATRYANSLSATAPGGAGTYPTYPTPQSRLLDSIFAAHFEHGQDISDPALLLHLARNAGLSTSASSQAIQDVRETNAEAVRSGTVVQGVPTLTVQGRWRVGGMQESDILLGVFERAFREASGQSSRPQQPPPQRPSQMNTHQPAPAPPPPPPQKLQRQSQEEQQRCESVETVEGRDGVPVRPRRGMWLKDMLIDESANNT